MFKVLFSILPICLFAQIENSNKDLEFKPPLLDDSEINIDGSIDENVWNNSLKLSNFTSYLPVDGRAAIDDTDIRIWYSKKSLYVAIIAEEIHGEVRSTLADRDNLENDDYIILFLDTYDDQRSAFAFAVNPLGQQADGTITDKTTTSRNSTLTFNLDDNPDYAFTSKGRLTDKGYVVEIEIPFKSLRYKKSDIQNWGFNVLRRVQHSGYRSTLFNVKLDVASFLAQSGRLINISGIEREKIFEINPELRSSIKRGPSTEKYKVASNDLIGVNLRYGLSSNITLNGTINPDFSQIEADVAQINYDPRRSLYFPEKRPFFLDGIELFSTPTRLIYTRKISNPAAAAKIAGKIGNTTVGFISAADNRGSSLSNFDPAYVNVIRLKRDLSEQNHIGFVYTDRIHDDLSNRVLAVDGKFIAKNKYSFRAQSGFSLTNNNLENAEIAPMWNIGANASGRKWSSSFSTTGYHGDFNPAVGFVERGDYVTISAGPTRRFYGKEDAFLQQLSLSYRLTGNWNYDDFISKNKPDDRRMYPSFSMQFKGGWRFTNFTWIEYFGYPEKFYTNYYIRSNNEFVSYIGTDELYNIGAMFELTTPQLESFSASFKYGFGRDPNYDEWAPGDLYLIESKIKWNPTDQIRLYLRYNQQKNFRPSDNSLVSESRTPRVKIEYQISSSIFLRGVIQYTSRYRDSLRDNSRTESPIYFKNEDGDFNLSVPVETNNIQADFLFSYRPTPGTLLFFGYGSFLTEPSRFRFQSIDRQSDGYFLKVSYLFK
jgi:hypothetical protein|tara:strand:+ start:2278 stop:4581 length:2304 start_codon:yes stop_codon:yes gene_type:complete